jgi:signal peptidase
MTEKEKNKDTASIIERFRTSDNKIVSVAREILWVSAVVGGIALLLFVISGTWPAVVTIESDSMVPNMNKGDLVFVVQKDRFGDLQAWADGMQNGYKKFGYYGDVIIFKPNGGTRANIPVISNIPVIGGPISEWFGGVHPIIHRAIVQQDPGPIQVYVNPGGASKTPGNYVLLPKENITGQKITLPSSDPNIGYILTSNITSPHGGYITKGDNNQVSDEGAMLSHYTNLGPIEPVKPEWIVGKALFTIPLAGYLPLNIIPVVIIIILLIVVHELYLRKKETEKSQEKKGRKKKTGNKK